MKNMSGWKRKPLMTNEAVSIPKPHRLWGRTNLPVYIAALMVAACGSPQSSDPEEPVVTIDARMLIGGQRADVDAVMGTPDCHEESAGTSCEYGPFTTAFFVNGKAANLTLPAVDDLRTYGLDLGEPSFQRGDTTRWETEIGGESAEVSRFTDFVYIKTQET